MNRARLAVAIILALPFTANASVERRQGETWQSYKQRLKGVAETYKKWGIEFKVEKGAVFTSESGPMPSYLKVTGGYEAADTVTMNVETGLGEHNSAAVALTGEFKVTPDSKKVTGSGVMFLKGTGVGGTFKYDSAKGLQLETGLEETFYSIGINIGNDEKGPVALGLKLGPARISIDPLKWARRCEEVAPFMASKAGEKVGGVLVRADVPTLAAAIADAPEPKLDRLKTVSVVSLKRLIAGESTPTISRITGIAVDKTNRDILLLGANQDGVEPIKPEILWALCRAIGKQGTVPYVSIDPDPADFAKPHHARIGGLPSELQNSLLADQLLKVDYALKHVIMGAITIDGIKNLPSVAQEAKDFHGMSARFWFVPKELLPGDVHVERNSDMSLYWFEATPIVRTEPVAFGPGAANNSSARGQIDSLAVHLTQNLAKIDATYPDIRLEQLRQIFSLATGLTILRQDPAQDIVREVLDQASKADIPSFDVQTTFEPIHREITLDGGLRKLTFNGGVFSGATIYGGTGPSTAPSKSRIDSFRAAAQDPAKTASMQAGQEFVLGDKVSASTLDSGRYATAIFWLSKGETKLATDEFERLYQANPDDGEALILKMTASLNGPDWQGIYRDAQRYVQKWPRDGKGYYWLGVAESQIGMMSQARIDADNAVQFAPDYPEAYMLRSDCRRFVNPQGSIDDATKAVELSPDNWLALSGRGLAYSDMRRYEEAASDFQRSVSLNPVSSFNWSNLGTMLLILKKYDESIQALSTAIALSPKEGILYLGRANAFFGQEKYKEALADFEKGVALDPTFESAVKDKMDECRKKIG